MNEPETMSAWTQSGYGEVDAVTRQQIRTPRPGAGEVLLRVRATALNNGAATSVHPAVGPHRAQLSRDAH